MRLIDGKLQAVETGSISIDGEITARARIK
jgi:hypothetical protein